MKGKSSSCMVCVNSALLGLDELKVHILTHHVRSVFLCDLCHRIYYQEDDINEHVASAHLKDDEILKTVKLESHDALNLESQILDGPEDDDNSCNSASLCACVCDLCNHAFPLTSDLKTHILSVHNVQDTSTDDEVKLTQKVASVDCTATPYLNSNTIRLFGEAKASTSTRDKRPTKKAVLSRQPAPHECDVCGKQFVRERWLKKHKTAQHASAEEKPEVQNVAGDTVLEIHSNVRSAQDSVTAYPTAEKAKDTHRRNSVVSSSHDLDPDWTPDDDVTEFDDVIASVSDDGSEAANCDVAVKPELSEDNVANNCGALTSLDTKKLSNRAVTSPDTNTESKKARPRPKPKQTPFRCSVCKRYLASDDRLKVHMVIHRSDDDLRCYECDKIFTCKANLKRHMDVHMQLQCDFCGLKGQDFKSLDDHMKEHIQGPPEHKCERCDKMFYLQQTLKRHLMCHGKQNSTQCTICEHVCVNTKAFKRHMKHHTGDTFDCLQCDKKFFHKNSLKWHMLYHTGEMPFTCEVCGTGFRTQVSLKHHYQRKHANMPKDYKCSVCSKAFHWKSSLDAHMTSHSDVRPFTCDECRKSFKTAHQLRGHMTIHSSVKPFKCDLCPYAAQYQSLLRSHQKQHATAKNFKCPHCESAFVCQRYLNSHVRGIHRLADVRPHACEQCGKTFGTRGRLKRHLLSHSTEQPYRCTMCSRSYKHRENLKEHQQKSGHQNASTE